jgi:hypothetical protein
MSDEPAVPVTQDVAPVKPNGVKAFFATTVGRIVLIAGAVAVLLAILGVVAVILLGGLAGQAGPEVAPGVVTPSQPTTQTATATVPAVAQVGLDEVFSPRNPFEPVVIPKSAMRTENEGDTSTGDEGTLTLVRIVEEDGVRKAVLTLGSTTYTVAAGEQLDSTPWQVVTVGSSSVTMLFGDSQMVLTVGQGIQAK